MASPSPDAPPRPPRPAAAADPSADDANAGASASANADDAAPAAAGRASAVRHRRVLQAAASARRDVSSFVSSVSAPKPPRAPAAAKSARRRSLVPLPDDARRRLRELERALAERDAALLALKKQLGRALIKARHARQERDAAAARLARAVALLRRQHAALLAARTDAATLLDDVDACVAVVRAAPPRADAPRAGAPCALRAGVEHLVSAAEMARAKVAAPLVDFAAAVDADDDDAHSVASLASSLADDRDAHVETLVELVQLLDARLSTADSDGAAAAAVQRARRTIQGARAHDAHRASDGAAAQTETALRDAQRQLSDMTARVNALHKIAERAVNADEALAKNVQLESQLHAAKKTIQRMLQQRCSAASSRRHAASDAPAPVNWRRRAASARGGASGGASDGAPGEAEHARAPPSQQRAALRAHGASAETVRRILDWRQRASENHALPPAGGGAHAVDALDERLVNGEGQSVVDSFGSVSAKSLPVQGFLKRHDSFLSMGGISASGEEIMLANGRNPFASSSTPKAEGLKFLLG
ncbi:hypothetical protein FGB62_157g018 [Gracilaria domingensis]|nr:hypothetical protein FGB62_157g018 [Gracilaria domingensis]